MNARVLLHIANCCSLLFIAGLGATYAFYWGFMVRGNVNIYILIGVLVTIALRAWAKRIDPLVINPMQVHPLPKWINTAGVLLYILTVVLRSMHLPGVLICYGLSVAAMLTAFVLSIVMAPKTEVSNPDVIDDIKYE